MKKIAVNICCFKSHAKLPHNPECANLLVTRWCAQMCVCLPLLYALKQGHLGVLVYSRGSHEQKIECQLQVDVFDATVHWKHPHFLSQCWAGQPTCLGNGLPCCVVGSVTVIQRQINSLWCLSYAVTFDSVLSFLWSWRNEVKTEKFMRICVEVYGWFSMAFYPVLCYHIYSNAR